MARKCGGAARRAGGGDGHPHVFFAAVQNSHRLDAADAVRRDVDAGFHQGQFLAGGPAEVEAELHEQSKLRDAMVIPTGWERVKEWFARRFLCPCRRRRRTARWNKVSPCTLSDFQHQADHLDRRSRSRPSGFRRISASSRLARRAGLLDPRPCLPQGRGCRENEGQRRRPSVCGPAHVIISASRSAAKSSSSRRRAFPDA